MAFWTLIAISRGQPPAIKVAKRSTVLCLLFGFDISGIPRVDLLFNAHSSTVTMCFVCLCTVIVKAK